MSQFDQYNEDAERLISQGQYQEALQAVEQSISQGGLSARTLVNRAIILVNLGDQQQAIQDLNQAHEMNPSQEQSARIDQLIDELTNHAAQAVNFNPETDNSQYQDGETGTRSLGGDLNAGTTDRGLATAVISGLMSSGQGGGYNQHQQGNKLGMLSSLFGGSNRMSSGGMGGMGGSSMGGLGSAGGLLSAVLGGSGSGGRYSNQGGYGGQSGYGGQGYGGQGGYGSQGGSGLGNVMGQFFGGSGGMGGGNHNGGGHHNGGGFGGGFGGMGGGNGGHQGGHQGGHHGGGGW